MAVTNSIYDEVIFQVTVTWEDVLFELDRESEDDSYLSDVFLSLPEEKQKKLMDEFRYDIKHNLEYMGEVNVENVSAACEEFVEEVKRIAEEVS